MASVGKSFFGDYYCVRQGTNPISYGYHGTDIFYKKYFRVTSSNNGSELLYQDQQNYLTKDNLLFICQVERRNSELLTPTSVNFKVINYDNTTFDIYTERAFDSGVIGYDYEGDTALLMIVVDSSWLIGLGWIKGYTVQINYGSNNSTYISRTYMANGQGASYGQGTYLGRVSSTYKRDLYFNSSNQISSRVPYNDDDVKTYIQEWYDTTIDCAGIFTSNRVKKYNYSYFNDKIYCRVTLKPFLSSSNRAPSKIVFWSQSGSGYTSSTYSFNNDNFTYDVPQDWNNISSVGILIENPKFKYSSNNTPYSTLIILQQVELQSQKSYFPVLDIKQSISNMLTEVIPNGYKAESVLDFSFTFSEECPYDFSGDGVKFELVNSNNSSFSFDNIGTWTQSKNKISFSLDRTKFLHQYQLSDNDILILDDDTTCFEEGNYFLRAINVYSLFESQTKNSVDFSNSIVSMTKEENFIAIKGFEYQVQYEETEGDTPKIYNVDSNAIIKDERILLGNKDSIRTIYSTRTGQQHTVQSIGYVFKISYSLDLYQYFEVSLLPSISADGTELYLSFDNIKDKIFEQDAQSAYIKIRASYFFAENGKSYTVQSFERPFLLSVLRSSIQLDRVSYDNNNLFIRVANNGGDQNVYYTANDFIEQRIINNQDIGLSRANGTEQLYLLFSYGTSTNEQLGFYINTSNTGKTPAELLTLLQENSFNKIPLALLDSITNNNFSKFVNGAKGKTVKVTGEYQYNYGKVGDDLTSKIVTILELSEFSFQISSGIPVLALRQNGIIINPKLNETLDNNIAERINLKTKLNNGVNIGKAVEVVVCDEAGNPLTDADNKNITCDIAFQGVQVDGKYTRTFTFDGVNLQELRDKQDRHTTAINNQAAQITENATAITTTNQHVGQVDTSVGNLINTITSNYYKVIKQESNEISTKVSSGAGREDFNGSFTFEDIPQNAVCNYLVGFNITQNNDALFQGGTTGQYPLHLKSTSISQNGTTRTISYNGTYRSRTDDDNVGKFKVVAILYYSMTA